MYVANEKDDLIIREPGSPDSRINHSHLARVIAARRARGLSAAGPQPTAEEACLRTFAAMARRHERDRKETEDAVITAAKQFPRAVLTRVMRALEQAGDDAFTLRQLTLVRRARRRTFISLDRRYQK